VALNRDQILKADDLPTREVECPEWGGSVLVRALSGAERDAWEASSLAQKTTLDGKGTEFVPELANRRAKLVVQAVVDEDGKRVFVDRDAAELGAKSAKVLDRLFDVISELSGLSEESAGEIEGNSDAAPSGNSGSE
jgi:hypothetical protein